MPHSRQPHQADMGESVLPAAQCPYALCMYHRTLETLLNFIFSLGITLCYWRLSVVQDKGILDVIRYPSLLCINLN